ncbi:hypothetical protein ACF0H5_005079 [Mactra antiquata]
MATTISDSYFCDLLNSSDLHDVTLEREGIQRERESGKREAVQWSRIVQYFSTIQDKISWRDKSRLHH